MLAFKYSAIDKTELFLYASKQLQNVVRLFYGTESSPLCPVALALLAL